VFTLEVILFSYLFFVLLAFFIESVYSTNLELFYLVVCSTLLLQTNIVFLRRRLSRARFCFLHRPIANLELQNTVSIALSYFTQFFIITHCRCPLNGLHRYSRVVASCPRVHFSWPDPSRQVPDATRRYRRLPDVILPIRVEFCKDDVHFMRCTSAALKSLIIMGHLDMNDELWTQKLVWFLTKCSWYKTD